MSVNKLEEVKKTPEQQQQQQVANFLNNPKVIQQIQSIGSSISADKLANLALNEIRKNPKLAQCTTTSLLGGILQCAAFGLDPDSNKKLVYLIPYENREKGRYVNNKWEEGALIDIQLQVQISYMGMITVIMRNPDVAKVTSRVVFEKDVFDYEYGLDETLKHKPTNEVEPGEMTHVYAVIHMKDGTKMFEVMSRKQVNHVALTSKTVKGLKEDGVTLNATAKTPWDMHYDEMSRKTVFRRLSKWAIFADVAEANSIEDNNNHGSMWTPDTIEGSTNKTKAIAKSSVQAIGKSDVEPLQTIQIVDGQQVNTSTGEVLVEAPPAQLSEANPYFD